MPDAKPAKSVARTIAGECVGARLRALNRKVTRIYDEAVRPYGLSFPQMNVLTIVTLRGPIAPVDVAAILELEKSTLSRNVARMEENGWIDVLPGEGGGQLLRTTPAGARLLRAAEAGWRAAQDEVESILGARTATSLRRTTDRLLTQDRT